MEETKFVGFPRTDSKTQKIDEKAASPLVHVEMKKVHLSSTQLVAHSESNVSRALRATEAEQHLLCQLAPIL